MIDTPKIRLVFFTNKNCEQTMIVDHIDNWKIYFKNPIWEIVFKELKTLNGNTPVTEKKLFNDDIILKVFENKTITETNPAAELETHRKYIDIHSTLFNAERIDWYPASLLKVKIPYAEEEDAEYYERQKPAYASILMDPGIFAAFWPEDAHMPGLVTEEISQMIRKAVFKINIDITR
jgi:YhcH/YjgK/YiaL family protein